MTTYKPVYSEDHEPKGGPMRFIGAALIVLLLVALVAASLSTEPEGAAQPVVCDDCDEDEWDDDDDGEGVLWFWRPFHWWFWTSPEPAHTHVAPPRAGVRSTAPASPSVSSPIRRPAGTTSPTRTAPAGGRSFSSPGRVGGFAGRR